MNVEVLIVSEPEIDEVFAEIMIDRVGAVNVFKKPDEKYEAVIYLAIYEESVRKGFTTELKMDLDDLISALNTARQKLG